MADSHAAPDDVATANRSGSCLVSGCWGMARSVLLPSDMLFPFPHRVPLGSGRAQEPGGCVRAAPVVASGPIAHVGRKLWRKEGPMRNVARCVIVAAVICFSTVRCDGESAPICDSGRLTAALESAGPGDTVRDLLRWALHGAGGRVAGRRGSGASILVSKGRFGRPGGARDVRNVLDVAVESAPWRFRRRAGPRRSSASS